VEVTWEGAGGKEPVVDIRMAVETVITVEEMVEEMVEETAMADGREDEDEARATLHRGLIADLKPMELAPMAPAPTGVPAMAAAVGDECFNTCSSFQVSAYVYCCFPPDPPTWGQRDEHKHVLDSSPPVCVHAAFLRFLCRNRTGWV
jgi:hypothetical protein